MTLAVSENDLKEIDLKLLKALYETQGQFAFVFKDQCLDLKQKIKRLSSSVGLQITETSESEWTLKKTNWESHKLDQKQSFLQLLEKNQQNQAQKVNQEDLVEQIQKSDLGCHDPEVKKKKRKACANCTCGLKEELEGLEKQNQKSSCGSCYLGDAFRCEGCPYRGLPAFLPGEQIKLKQNEDVEVSSENVTFKKDSGVVKLDL